MKNFIKWLDNFWYHYKWPTIIITFFVAVFGICISQMVTRNNYDAYILYSGGHFFTAEEEKAVMNSLEYVMEDYDGNGEKSLCMTKFIVLSEEELDAARAAAEAEGEVLAYNYQTRTEALKQFEMEVMTGQSYLCFLSEAMYGRAADAERFVALSAVAGGEVQGAYDEYAVRLADTEFGKYFSAALSPLGEDTLVCLRRISVTDAASEKATEEYENYKDMFSALLAFEVK